MKVTVERDGWYDYKEENAWFNQDTNEDEEDDEEEYEEDEE